MRLFDWLKKRNTLCMKCLFYYILFIYQSHKINYFISTEVYPQRWQWWKNRSVFSRSQSATRTMKFHKWNTSFAASDWTKDVFHLWKVIVQQATSSLARKLASRLFIFKMSERFVDADSVDNFIAEQEDKATLHKTQRDVKLLQTFLGTRNELRIVSRMEKTEAFGRQWQWVKTLLWCEYVVIYH